VSVEITRWWPQPPAGSRDWLTQHHGEPLPPGIKADLAAAGGPAVAVLADKDVDWIEAVAKGEEPDAEPHA